MTGTAWHSIARIVTLIVCMNAVAGCLSGQAIEFESGGLRYQTMTRDGLTVMWAELPSQIKNFTVLQIAVSNGSSSTRTVRPEDFRIEREDGSVLPAVPAHKVVQGFLDRGGRGDVVKLVSTYEMGLYGLSRFQSTSGYEQRRQAAFAEVNSAKIKAAAAASAIVLVASKLKPGESTDGAIFFSTANRIPGPGKLIVTPGAVRFEFPFGGDRHPGELTRRP